MWHVWGRGETYVVLWVWKTEGKRHFEELGVDGRMI
jgi:hypothetical protein